MRRHWPFEDELGWWLARCSGREMIPLAHEQHCRPVVPAPVAAGAGGQASDVVWDGVVAAGAEEQIHQAISVIVHQRVFEAA